MTEAGVDRVMSRVREEREWLVLFRFLECGGVTSYRPRFRGWFLDAIMAL